MPQGISVYYLVIYRLVILSECLKYIPSIIIYQYVEYFEKLSIKNDSTQHQFSEFQKEASRKIVVSGQFSSEDAQHLQKRSSPVPMLPKLPRDKLVERTSGVSGPSYLLSMSTRQCYFHRNSYTSLHIELYIMKSILQIKK